MGKAGGIIALIAGIFGIFAAGITLFLGGIGGAVEAEGADQIIGFGWGGVIFSFAVIILGAVSMNNNSKIPGILIILASISGIVLGGTLVAIFMGLALIGGLLTLFGKANKSESYD